MNLIPDNEPSLILKRLIIVGIIGAVSILTFFWAFLAIFASTTIAREHEGNLSVLLGIILPAIFLLAGIYCIFRFVPSMFTYLRRELNGRYQISSTSEALFVIPHYDDKMTFLWEDITMIHVHRNLVACSALSILLKNGTGWTFGNTYSKRTLEELRITLLEWKTKQACEFVLEVEGVGAP